MTNLPEYLLRLPRTADEHAGFFPFMADKTGVAMPYARLEPKQVVGSNFKYQKVFGEDNFVAAGVVFIPPGGEKPAKPSKDNCYVSGSGAVDITLGRGRRYFVGSGL